MYKFIDSGIILALVTATLYCVGVAEYNGFLIQLKLDYSIVDRDINQTLYYGFLKAFPKAFYLIAILALGRFAYSHLILEAWYGFFLKKHTWVTRLVKFRRFWRGRKPDCKALIASQRSSINFFIYLIFATGFIYSLAYFEKNGVAEGKKLADAIASNKVLEKDYPTISITLNNKPMELVKVVCGSRNCAGYDKANKTMYYFPQDVFSYKPIIKP